MNENNGNGGQPHNRAADILISLSVGLAAGVAGALLLAPASGRETRGRIGRVANRLADDAGAQAGRAGDTIKNLASQVEHAVLEGKSAFRQSQDGPKS